MKKRILSILLAAALLTGCGSQNVQQQAKAANQEAQAAEENNTSKESQSTEEALSDSTLDFDTVDTVRFAIMTNGFDHYIYLIAKKEGLFEKYGLDVQATEYGRGINTVDALTNGTEDVGNAANYAIINRLGNTKNNTNLVFISEQSKGGDQNGGLYVAPEYADDLSKLDGSKGFLSVLGTASEYSTSVVIKHLGLDEKKQNIINVDSLSTELAMVTTNEASAIVASGSLGKKVEEAGWVLAVPSTEYEAISGAWFLSTDEFVNTHPQAVAKLLLALQDGFEYIKSNMDESAAYIESTIGLSAEDFKRNWSSLESSIGISQEGLEELREMEKWAYGHGNYEEEFDPADFIRTEPIELAFPERLTLEN